MRLRDLIAVVAITSLAFVDSAFAEEAGAVASVGWAPIGAGIGMGVAVFGGALGQSRAAAAALEGISRNPGASSQMQLPLILGLALIESLVILGFLICGKLGGLL